MTESTSIEAYRKISKNGLLRGIKLLVLKHLAESEEPMTAAEVAWAIQEHQLDSVRPRFAQLHAKGVIRKSGKRICKITGMTSLTWELTGDMPMKPEPKKDYQSGMINNKKDLERINREYELCREAE